MPPNNNSHTFVLAQFTEDENSKTFLDFDSLPEALDGICQIFEQKLKYSNRDEQ